MLSRFTQKALAGEDPLYPQRRSYHLSDLADHLQPGGPKRILSLDGGGVRGAIAIAVLERIESILRRRHGNHPGFRLSDYYDLIGGTSTGAIIAAGLAAKSYSASDIRELYQDIVPRVFKNPGFLPRVGIFRSRFDGNQLLTQLKSILGEMSLGDPTLATGLAVIAKRVDTDSTWVMHNNPRGKYYNDSADGKNIGNRNFPLANVVRASTAAPYYFEPQQIEIMRKPRSVKGVFVDGGVTPHNNPSLQLFLLATVEQYGFGWQAGADKISLTSVGTGSLNNDIDPRRAVRMPTAIQAKEALTSMISGAEDFVEMMMQLLSDPQDPLKIDSVLGTLDGVRITEAQRLAYQRYQTRLEAPSLREELGIGLSKRQLDRVRDMTNPDGFQIAYEIGQAIADRKVKESHFPEMFNLGDCAKPTDANQNASLDAGTTMMARPSGPLAPSARVL